MSRIKKIKLVHTLAVEKHQQNIKQLNELDNILSEKKRQFDYLMGCYHQYQSTKLDNPKLFKNSPLLENYENFTCKLSNAMELSKFDIEKLNDQRKEIVAVVMKSHQYCTGLADLIDIINKKQEKLQLKCEQKLLDEWVQNKHG